MNGMSVSKEEQSEAGGDLSKGGLGRVPGLAAVLVAVVLLVGAAPPAVASSGPGSMESRLDSVAAFLGEALVKAAETGDVQSVERIIAAGAEVNMAVSGDGTALIGAVRRGQMQMIDYLLARGADVNVTSPGDGSPLIAAARTGRAAIVQLLLDRGARMDDLVPGDENALMQAVIGGRAEVVRLLLERGADVHVRSVEGPRIRTALRLARELSNTEIERMLLAAGARD